MTYFIPKRLSFLFIILSNSLLFSQHTDTDQFSENLDTVQIYNDNPLKIEEYGFHKQKGFVGRLFQSKSVAAYEYSYPEDYAPAVYIENPNKNKKRYIKSVFLRIKSLSKQINLYLFLYSFDKSQNKIIKKLYQKELEIGNSNRLKVINLGPQHIEFPKKGVLIQIEGIENGTSKLKMKDAPENEQSSSYFISKDHKVYKVFSELSSDILIKNSNFMMGLSAYIAE